MIGASLKQDSRARSNTERFLALFLGLSMLTHGLYYSKEWLLFGFILTAYIMSTHLHKRVNLVPEKFSTLGRTDFLLLGLLLCSLLGILHPVKLTDGFFEALHWGAFWFVYRLGVQISTDETAKNNLMKYIEWLALAIAVIGWLPWVSKVGGRLSSVFGYPNAAAVFLGAVLLLHPRKRLVSILLAFSLLGTGSRAGVGLFLIVLVSRQFILGFSFLRFPLILLIRRKLFSEVKIKSKYRSGLLGLIVGSTGLVLMLIYYKPAWDNLTAWGFSSSSWQERLVYFKNGISLAWNAGGVPQAGGWWAFPTLQPFPYWTADPHSSIIHILLNQGALGVVSVGIWGSLTLAWAMTTWGKNQMLTKTGPELEETKTQFRVFTALLFMVLHSLVDADFSFGALGVLFWLLFGSLQRRSDYVRTIVSKRSRLFYRLSKMGMLGLSFTVCLVCLGTLLNPKFFEREQVWNIQAVQLSEQDPNISTELWSRSLKRDQTQIEVRRELAEHLLRQGNLDSGLEAVKEVLRWQPFDLEAYEWGQSVVWNAAERYRQTYPHLAMTLYRWVEDVPETIMGRLDNLNSLDRRLWQGHKDFLPSQHIKLFAEYARQRQLTQLPPQHKL